MEKKIYMTPQMECTQIETATMIAGSIASVSPNAARTLKTMSTD